MRALVCLVILLAGCTPRGGFVGDAAFHSAEQHYRIRYDESGRRLLPRPWRALNYDYDARGLRAVRRDRHWVDAYEHEHGRLRWPRVDLLFQRGGEGASHLWVRSVLIDPLDVQMGMEGALSRSARLPASDPNRLPLVPREARRFALSDSRESDAGVVVVDGRRGRYSRRESFDGSHHAVVATVDSGQFASVGGVEFHIWLVLGVSGDSDRRERDEAALLRLVRRLDFAL
ncbi:MAG: hypothetical protein AB8I08_13405 [Sandaracinaceae bacterium]